MNHTALKTFAQDARRKLRDLIGARLDYVLTADTAELRQQAAQVNELRASLKAEGRDPLIERVAYTWFNRLAALRFMDANDYHPFGARVITPATANETLPELLQQARAGALDPDLASIPTVRRSLTTGQLIIEFLSGRIPVDHPEAQVFKLLLVAACNYYHRLMPFMFEKIGDATELLLPEDLLTDHSIVADFREYLTDEDCRSEETLGWFYQFYISEKKDAVTARKAAVPKEDIPAVTQLFTPHWIVRYLVENSLGRLWLLNRPHSLLREKMPYYIEGDAETDFLKITKPQEIRLIDPAGGSGHMLTYAFDLLYAIYEEEGYDAPEIPTLILKHNLYGVDICDRAVALAAFALCMKARAKDTRFFRRMLAAGGLPLQPHLIPLQEIRFAEGELSAYFKALGTQPSTLNPQLTTLLYQFEEAKNFGSLIQPCLSESEISNVRSQILERISVTQQLDLAVSDTHAKVLRVLEQAEYLTQRYHVVVANPPYMGWKTMNPPLKSFAKENFKDAREDLFSMFIERCFTLPITSGFVGMMTPFTWMFLGSYEKLRKLMLQRSSLSSLVRPELHAFFDSAFVSICAFSITCKSAPGRKGVFIDLCQFYGADQQDTKALEAIRNPNCAWRYRAGASDFQRIPSCPIAYALPDTVMRLFHEHKTLGDNFTARQGLATTENARFVRLWHEVDLSRIGFHFTSQTETIGCAEMWFPYNKGGEFRKWWGNQRYVVNWAKNGEAIKSAIVNKYPYLNGNPNFVAKNQEFYFRTSVSFSKIGSGFPSFKLFPNGFIFDVAGSSIFANSEIDQTQVLAFCNTSIARMILAALAPTLNVEIQQIQSLPLSLRPAWPELKAIVDEMVLISRADWNNFETSWDFRDLPLLRPGLKGATLEATWQNWKAQCDAAMRRMQELETENNQLFIAAYGLQNEIKPEVPEDQITLARADARKDMAAFLSYAVGCMMGRYSLAAPGLILADAGPTLADYDRIVAKRRADQPSTLNPQPSGFQPDSDGILPVLDGEWFSDDIVGQSRQFLRVTFGEETFAENLTFIQASLGKELRKYFEKEFYKDHLKTYKKRPIYWMFSSPEGSFQALIYLHRYTKDTLHLLLNEYVRKFIEKLEERQRHLNGVRLNEAARPGDVTKTTKELVEIEKMLKELRDWERNVLLPLAQQRIELDLDDGVKVNYQKLKGAVVPIPGLEKQEEE